MVYLQSLEQTLIPRIDTKATKLDKLGICENGVLFVTSKVGRANLISKYYELLNNKRNHGRIA